MSVTDQLCCSYKCDWMSLSPSGFSYNLRSRWQTHFPSDGPDDGSQPQTWPFAQTTLHLVSAEWIVVWESLAKRNEQFYLGFVSFVKPISCTASSLLACTSVCARRARAELPWITEQPLLVLLLLIRVSWTHTAVPRLSPHFGYSRFPTFLECCPPSFSRISCFGHNNLLRSCMTPFSSTCLPMHSDQPPWAAPISYCHGQLDNSKDVCRVPALSGRFQAWL